MNEVVRAMVNKCNGDIKYVGKYPLNDQFTIVESNLILILFPFIHRYQHEKQFGLQGYFHFQI
jgi:hypothetical protein